MLDVDDDVEEKFVAVTGDTGEVPPVLNGGEGWYDGYGAGVYGG